MEKSLNFIKIIALLLIIILPTTSVKAVGAEPVQAYTANIEKARKAIVSISATVSMSAYNDNNNWSGTGFITDKKQGFVVTNNHVVGGPSIGTYFITFHDGRQAEAKLLYYDIWQDYAILKVNPSEIPETTEQISFAKDLAKQNQSVFVIGNSEGQGFSFHSGYISNLYAISGSMPQCSYIINLNISGGASGSPVLNENNEAIGVLYGSGASYALALHGSYLRHALSSLKQGKLPPRKHIGITTDLYSLDKAAKHRNFPKNEIDEYIKNFPDARNMAVVVSNTLSGSPAAEMLQPGDIIMAADGKALGGSLAVLDDAMNLCQKDTVKLTIYRNGEKLEIQVKLYDINNNQINRMVDFAGAVFFEADDYIGAVFGIPVNSLTVVNVKAGSSFSNIPLQYSREDRNYYRIQMKAINGRTTSNLNELIKAIPEITKNKFINILFRNYKPYFPNFGNRWSDIISAHSLLTYDLTLDSVDTNPRLLKYDPNSGDWIAEDIK